jgi:hypothetical protein
VSVFALPRTAIPTRVLLTEGAAHPGEMYVMERVPQHEGSESVLEMLNRPQAFYPFRADPGTDVMLVAKVHTMAVTLDRQAPMADPARLSAAKLLGIEVVLAGGTTFNGWASAELPPEHSRLLDYLNSTQDPFFAVWTHAATHYINRAHVLYARPMD